jgi:aryl-alcohol dehydrogenase-like predicted oxidoreductase
MRAVEGSLNRLDTDYIDVYILHQPDPATPIDETLRALDDLVRAGKVRYIACADLAAWQVCEAVWTSRSQNLESFVSAGADYNMLRRGIEQDLVPFCEAYGVGIVPTAPLAGGFLTGKYRRGQALPDDSRFGSPPPFAGAKFQDLGRYDRVLSETNFDRLDRLESFARDRGHTTTELALAWLLSRPCLAVVPIGVTTVAQLEADVSGLGWELSDDELIEIDGILQTGP